VVWCLFQVQAEARGMQLAEGVREVVGKNSSVISEPGRP
jgi:hypothetical protein